MRAIAVGLVLGGVALSAESDANSLAIAGDYVGRVENRDIKARVVAKGKDEFELTVYPPTGAGPARTAVGRATGRVVEFVVGTRKATVENGVLTLFEAGRAAATLKRVGGGEAPKGRNGKESGKFTSTVLPVDVSKLLTRLAWSADGKSLYVVETEGLVRKLDLPDFRESKRRALEAKCSDFALSSVGPVLLLGATQHVVLLDENLDEVQREHVPGALAVASAPALDHAFLVGDRAIGVWPLKKKGRINGIPASAFARAAIRVKRTTRQPAAIDFRLATCTTDGEYLLVAPDHRITRFRIRRGSLVLEEQGWKIGSSGQPTAMSVGGNPPRVALTFGGGNDQPPGHPPVGYGTYVYDVTDLRIPVTTIEPGAYPRTVGFDTAAGLVYGQASDYELVVFNEAGAKLGSFDLGKNARVERDRTQLILPHPDGGRTLVLTEKHLYWCTVPEDWRKAKPR